MVGLEPEIFCKLTMCSTTELIHVLCFGVLHGPDLGFSFTSQERAMHNTGMAKYLGFFVCCWWWCWVVLFFWQEEADMVGGLI